MQALSNQRQIAETSNIQVYVRVRPPLQREIGQDGSYKRCVLVQRSETDMQKVHVSLTGEPVIIQGNSDKAIPGVASYSFPTIFDLESTQNDIYSNSQIKATVRDVVQKGVNGTVFAYGQTGSGKTYTMYGDETKRERLLENPDGLGVVQRSVLELFKELNDRQSPSGAVEESKVDLGGTGVQMLGEECEEEVDEDSDDTGTVIGDIEEDTSVFVAIYQIYMEHVNDLLSKNVGSNLGVRRDSGGGFYVQGLRQNHVKGPKEVLKLITKAMKNRTQSSTNMNEFSSRSHLIVTLTVNIRDGRDGSLTSSKLNLVDLAGSERVKQSGVDGQRLQEACAINKSLFALAGVVDKLQKGATKQIGYRNSRLTTLLADSLGGNCRTTLLAMLSPSQEFCKESSNTLSFANKCSKVQNVVKSNKYHKALPSSVPCLKRVDKNNLAHAGSRNKGALPWHGVEAALKKNMIDSQQWGKIATFVAGSDDWPNKVVLLHGCPSSHQAVVHFLPMFMHLEYQCILIDMPGYGDSTGAKVGSRSEEVLKKDGSGGVVKFVIKHYGLESPMLLGYDWGGAIALKLGIESSKSYSKIIAFHPSYNEEEKDELKKLKTPTLIQWCKQDQFHSWKQFQKLAEKIPNKTIHTFNALPYRPEYPKGAYKKFSDVICIEIVKFVTGTDPSAAAVQVFEAKKEAGQSTTGKKVTAVNTLMVAEDLTKEDIVAMTTKPDEQQEAFDTLKQLMSTKAGTKDLMKSRLDPTHPAKNKYKLLASFIPDLDLSTPDFLVKFGVLEEAPKGWDEMMASPRYFAGRAQVLVPWYIQNKQPDAPDYMALSPVPTNNGEKFVSHRAEIVKVESDCMHVQTPGNTDVIKVANQEIYNLNQPQYFAKDVVGNTIFEDGLICDYSSATMKMKMLEIAFKLSPLVKRLDFAQAEECKKIQLECVRVIRTSLDLITFNKGEVKTVHADRAKTGSVGKLALYGQGNCHGVSSTMAAFLKAFGPILGIDLRYRGGWSFGGGGEISNQVERHQWLEFTLRPSMEVYACDLWYMGVNEAYCGEESIKYVTYPVDLAYTELMYPNGKLIVGTKIEKVKPTDLKLD